MWNIKITLSKSVILLVITLFGTHALAGKAPLTQSEALERGKQISNVKYTLELDLAKSEKTFSGVNTIGFTLSKLPAGKIWLDFNAGSISRLDVNGVSIKPKHDGQRIEIPIKKLSKGRNRIAVTYSGSFSKDGSGLYRFEDTEDGGVYIYSDFEPYDANRLFPIFDQPDIKATYALSVVVPIDWKVISSKREKQVSPVDKKTSRWVFSPTRSFSSYIFSLHAGTYSSWESKKSRIPTRLFARKSLSKYIKPESWFKTADTGFDYFEKYFAIPHPFTKLDMIIVPDFNSGAMENVGAVTFSERFVARGPEQKEFKRNRSEVILHEMAHMWFGNLVTMKWWDDLWLNESFATYMAYKALTEATEYTDSWRSFSSDMKGWAYWEDQLVTTHPIVANVENTDAAFSNFDGITYGKGASALKQLEFLIGSAAFQKGVQNYLKDHSFDNATLKDFMASLASASKVDLNPWIKEWLNTAGLNSLLAKTTCKEGKVSKFSLTQTSPKDHPTLRTHRTRAGLFYHTKEKGLHFQKAFTLTYAGAQHEVTDLIGEDCPDLVFLNYQDYDYAKVLLDEKSISTVKQYLGTLDDTFTRSMIWQSLWEMVRDAKLPIQDYADITFKHLKSETDADIIGTTLDTLLGRWPRSPSVIAYFPKQSSSEKKSFERFQDRLLKFTQTGLGGAEPGSDIQRIWFKSYIKANQRPSQTAGLVKILEGVTKVPGLVLDQDLRWTIIKQLSFSNSPALPKLLSAEQLKDPSSHGKKAALAVDALRPDRSIKKKWVKLLLNRKAQKKLSLAEMKQVMWNLFPRGQERFLKPFASQYYESLSPISKKQDGKFAEAFSSNLAPLFCEPKSNQVMQKFIDRSAQKLGPIVTRELRIEHQEDSRCINVMSAARSKDLRL